MHVLVSARSRWSLLAAIAVQRARWSRSHPLTRQLDGWARAASQPEPVGGVKIHPYVVAYLLHDLPIDERNQDRRGRLSTVLQSWRGQPATPLGDLRKAGPSAG
jgi:DNA invertase Pin-like site-specific DNA recombinase